MLVDWHDHFWMVRNASLLEFFALVSLRKSRQRLALQREQCTSEKGDRCLLYPSNRYNTH